MHAKLGRLAAYLWVLTVVAGLLVGAAASMPLSSGTIGAAGVGIGRCTTSGLTVVSNLASGSVASVTVSGLPAACGTASLEVTVSNGALSGSGATTVPAGGGSVSVSLAATPPLTAATRTDLILVGP